jgi:diguanylate cyclase (GGDEF)-like protein/PAS domain S-box-containing protein
MNNDEQSLQLLRYAQDLQELMVQHTKLQQQYQLVMQFMRHGNRSTDLLLDMVLQPTAIYLVTNDQGAISYASPAACKTLGLPGRELQGLPIGQLLPDAQWFGLKELLGVLAESSASQAIQQTKMIFAGTRAIAVQQTFDAMIMQVKGPEQKELYWLLQAEKSGNSRVEDVQIDILMQGEGEGDGDDAMMLVGADGMIRAVNSGFTNITGFSALDAVGESPRILAAGHNPPDFYEKFWAHLGDQGHWSGEIFNRRKNGQIYLEWLSVTAVKNSDRNTLGYVAAFVDMTQQSTAADSLAKLAFHDPLTGLPNRRLLKDRLAKAIAVVDNTQAMPGLCILYLDLNRFKPINDELGHDIGDLVLREVGVRLQASVRRGDTVARVGGDEFVVLLQRVDSTEVITQVIAAILNALSDPIQAGDHTLRIGASVGSARYPSDGPDAATLLKHADAAMFRAKRTGVLFCFYQADVDDDAARTPQTQGTR